MHARPLITAQPLSADIRDELISWIAEEALGGDREAAEWALLVAVARVQSRARNLLPPTLTISQIPSALSSALVPTLVHVFSLLLPLVTHIPLSLDLLNKASFVPQSKQEDLHSGVLQIPSSSTVVISEGGVTEGKLVEQGVLNVMAVQDVMSSQTLPYKFPFSDFSFPTDLSFLVLAEGSKSTFLKTDLEIPLRPHGISNLYKPESEISLPPPEKLNAFRELIIGAKTGKIEVQETTSKYIQNDFVEDRKLDKTKSPDDLKRTIIIARLSGLILHKTELSIDMWNHAKKLESRRLYRLRTAA